MLKEAVFKMEQKLRANGLKITAGRRSILEELRRRPGHFDAEGLLARMSERGVKVSRATVYRTLGHLVESGLLRKYDLGDRQTVYEPVAGHEHHEHLICVDCGRMIEFVQDDIERLQEEVCEKYGFKPVSHTLQIQGFCKLCSSKAGPEEY